MEILETIQLTAANQDEREALDLVRAKLGIQTVGAGPKGCDILRITKTQYLTHAQGTLMKLGIMRDYKPGVIDLRTPAPTSPKTGASD